MKSATMGSRLEGLGLVAVVAAVMLLAMPNSAHATADPPNPCFNNTMMYMSFFVGDSSDSGPTQLDQCSPASEEGGVGHNIFRDTTNQAANALRYTFYGRYLENNERSPLRQFYRRGAIDEHSADHLAHWGNGENDLAAGYTPTETTGEFIQRWLQPLRDHNVSTWFNTSWTSPRDTHRPTRYDSDVWTLTWGADMPILNDDLLVGVFGSYTNSDVDTTFNNGDVESKLGTVGPYFVYTLNDYIGFDTTVAGIFGQQENVVGSPVPGFRDSRGEQDVDGFFVAINANASYWMGNWGINGRVGFLHSDVETESYDLGPQLGGGATPSTTVRVPGTNSELTQIAVATQFNYFMDQGIPFCEEVKAMPFVRVTWNYDLDHENIQLPRGVSQHPNDDDEVVVNWGMSLFGNGPFSGSFEAGRTFARSRFEAWSVTGTLSYAF